MDYSESADLASRQEEAVNLHVRFWSAAAAGLSLISVLGAAEPGRLGVERGQTLTPRLPKLDNQRIADTIAEHLRQSGQLQLYKIDVAYQDGVALLQGCVGDAQQREEAIRIVQGVPGVERVQDRLVLLQANQPITQVQAPIQPVQGPPAQPAPPKIEGPGDAPPPRKVEDAPAQPGTGNAEPLPAYPGSFGGPYHLSPPRMPPYAWPTYAPYNNYSRVGYPQAYPYQAWPFIGPVYPFPKVPLGWRSVKLEWMDGHWWFSKTAQNHDWWRLRYW